MMVHDASFFSYSSPLTYSRMLAIIWFKMPYHTFSVWMAHISRMYCMSCYVWCLCPFAGLLTLGIEIEIYLFVSPCSMRFCVHIIRIWTCFKNFFKPHKRMATKRFFPFLWSAIFSRSIRSFILHVCIWIYFYVRCILYKT